MALVKKQPNAQTVMSIAFEINALDTMVNTSGNEVAFGVLTSGSNTVFDIATMPPNSVVIGGRVVVLTVFATSATNTIDVGDSDDTDRYTETGAIDLQDADAPASGFEMLGDGKIYAGNQAIRVTLANATASATAGRALVVVNFVMLGRASENLKTT